MQKGRKRSREDREGTPKIHSSKNGVRLCFNGYSILLDPDEAIALAKSLDTHARLCRCAQRAEDIAKPWQRSRIISIVKNC